MKTIISFGLIVVCLYSTPCISAEDWNCLICKDNENYQKLTINELKKRAESGDVEAQFSLSERYKYGHKVEANGSEHFKWLKRAATNGHAEAQYGIHVFYDKIGSILNDKIGLSDIKADENEAVRWLKMAANQNHIDAIKSLQQSSLLKSDFENAFLWGKKAAELGDASSQLTVGLYYEEGVNVTKNSAIAAYWIKKSAENGNPKAQEKLGHYYEVGFGVSKSIAEAAKWYLASAQRIKNSEILYKLGRFYLEGEGLPQNFFLARQYLSKAASDGHSDALLLLGKMYKEELATPYYLNLNPLLTLEELTVPADFRSASSSTETMNDDNIIAAHLCFNLSASKGNLEARRQKDEIEKEMTKEQIKRAQFLAASWKGEEL